MDNGLVQYMAMMAGMRPDREGMEFTSMEGLLLKKGLEFKVGEFTHEGEKKECFMNAYLLAERDDTVVYCEGFGCSLIPTLHAWCVRFDGTVVDPTWDNASGYIGIPFKLEYVRKTILRRGYYGVIDNYNERFPLLRKFNKRAVDKRVNGVPVDCDYSAAFNQAREMTKGMVMA
jgi:hypothetical protein